MRNAVEERVGLPPANAAGTGTAIDVRREPSRESSEGAAASNGAAVGSAAKLLERSASACLSRQCLLSDLRNFSASHRCCS